MKFCPNCEVKLKQGDFGLQCPKCDYVEGKEIKQTKQIVEESESQFNVLSENETTEALPTIKIECEKCGHESRSHHRTRLHLGYAPCSRRCFLY